MITFPDPLRVADATFLIRPVLHLAGSSDLMHLNSLVIVGAEPVIVDTGPALGRESWCEQVFGLVEPDDVRWVFLSHDDCDHTGNLEVVLQQCPNATLVTSWLCDQRMCPDVDVPLRRQRWLNEGERLTAGDRQLVALRPPVFDSPTTRGLFDLTTGVYWSTDAFGGAVSELVDHADELPVAAWAEAFDEFALMLSPWLSVTDPVLFGRWVDQLAATDPTIVVGAHGPSLSGAALDAAISRLRQLPGSQARAFPTNDLLHEMLAQLQPA